MTTVDDTNLSTPSDKDEDTKGKEFFNRPRAGGKTIWDWMQLLIIPFVLTVGGLLFSTYQHNADQQNVLDQQRATTLQTYIDNIQDLLLNHNLLKSNPNDPSNLYFDVAILAQARTLTALEELDPERKGRLLIFLYEDRLIGFVDKNDKIHEPIIDLTGADLSGADLSGADLSGAFLLSVNLSGADLRNVDFYGAFLGSANLSDADLSKADLDNAILLGTNLNGAIYLNQLQLDKVISCLDADLPQGLTCHRT
jgi:uncharacterized protein YjbI with pentapeptide repeats